MSDETVRIGQLRLRIPGVSAAQAKRLGQEIVRRVALGVTTEGRAEHLGAIELRISMPAGASESMLAERIAEEVLRQLR
jgi:type IV pilus biogenesis protein CpaD/CtpE